MPNWYPTSGSISYLAQFILPIVIAVYLALCARRLWQEKFEWLATALLAGFFAGCALLYFLAFLNDSVSSNAGRMAADWQVPAGALMLVFLLQFSFRFPSAGRAPVWQSRVVLLLSLLYLVSVSILAVSGLNLFANGNVVGRPIIAIIPMALEILWVSIIVLQQTTRMSRESNAAEQTQNSSAWWHHVLMPRGRSARAARDFVITLLVLFILIGMQLTQWTFPAPNPLDELALSLCTLLALLALALIYLDVIPGTTTFMPKLVGSALVLVLAIFSALGWLTFPSELNAVTADALGRENSPLVPLAYLLSASALLVVVGLPILLYQLLNKPLVALLEGVKRVTAGDLEVTIPVRSHDEIGLLTESFNAMAQSLRVEYAQQQQTETNLKTLAAEMEARATWRTRQLSALYDVSGIAADVEHLETLLDQVLERMMGAMQCDAGAVLLLGDKHTESDSMRFQIVAQRGIPSEFLLENEALRAVEGLSAQLRQQPEPVLVSDESTAPRVPTAVHTLGSNVLLMTPLQAEGRVFGIVSLLRDAARGGSTPLNRGANTSV